MIDLPPGIEPIEPLAEKPGSSVWLVRRGAEQLVLRVGGTARAHALEAALSSRLRHPGLVPTTEWGRTPGGASFLLRPFVPGRTLAQAFREGQPEEVQRWVRELLGILDRLHAAGLVHRDVKAGNVIVGDAGLALVDLDLMGRVSDASAAGGSAYHVAPEVLRGMPHGAAADLFSLGAMLALAWCGEPGPEFHRRFPAHSFWESAELDPETLPVDLAPLVRALVRRHPSERPASAAAAALLLPGADEPLRVDPRLSFLQGRERALEDVVERLERSRRAVVVEVSDREELEPLADAIELELAVHWRAVRREGVGATRERCEPEAQEAGPRFVVLRPEEEDESGLAERVLEVLVAPGDLRLAAVVPAGLGRRAERIVLARALEGEEARLDCLHWPRLTASALEEHLLRLGGGTSAHVARSLARSLHERTAGRLEDVNALLARAVEEDVLRPRGAAFELLRSDWPASPEPRAAWMARVDELPRRARRLLCAWAFLGGSAEPELLRRVSELDDRELEQALAELHAVGVHPVAGRREGQLGLAEPRWAEAASSALAPADRLNWHHRCAEALAAHGATAYRVAQHRLPLARTSAEHHAILDVVEELRRSGQPGRARSLCRLVEENAPPRARAVRERALVSRARIEIAQGGAARALAAVRGVYGTELADCAPPVLLVAAEAAELSGARSAARDLYQRVLEGRARADERLQATVGLGYAHLLDGDAQRALVEIEGRPRPRDAHGPAGALLNLRAGALARLDRLDEAAGVLDEALGRAEASGDPTLIGRTELNRAFVDRRRGRTAKAVGALERASVAFDRAGHVPFRAMAANNLGALQRDLGDLHRARELLEVALRLRRRAGDAHGAGSSLGGLALVHVEAGQVDAGLRLAERARALLERGGYGAELGLVELHTSIAHALAGDVTRVREVLDDPRLEAARRSQPLLVARAEAIAELSAGRRERARARLESAAAAGGPAGGLAEEFRFAALRASLEPEGREPLERMRSAARALDAPVRLAEAEWRGRARERDPEVETLAGWLRTFERAGRTDLVFAVARELAAAHDRAGRRAERRRAAERAQAAEEALLEGLPAAARQAARGRLLLLAGGEPAPRGRPGLELEWFLACNRRLAAEERLEELLLAIIDVALETTGAPRGLLVLLEGERAQVEVARGMDRATMAPEEAHFSRSVVLSAVQSGAPVLTTDAELDERFAKMESVSTLHLRSVLCVPFAAVSSDVRGALYLDDAEVRAAFDEVDVERVSALADQASIAITNLRRRAEIEALNARLVRRVEYQEDELSRARNLLRRAGRRAPLGGLVGASEAMQRVYYMIERLAPTDLTVLVTGPSGSGKDLVARALHEYSPRASGPLLIENVAAVPAELVESELFGHLRGAFTGATADRRGLFEEADGGTFFLDEIGEMSLELQAKLLRLLESGEFRPVGSRETLKRDVRVIAATHRDLPELVRNGLFREDLYYRLDAAEIRLPSLAEHPDDIPLLVHHFLAQLNEKHGTAKEVDEAVVAALFRRAWPGEVRELANEVARLYFLAGESIVDPGAVRPPAAVPLSRDPMPASYRLEDLERAAILRALEATSQRKDRAARMLGISRAGLYAKLARLGLDTKTRRA